MKRFLFNRRMFFMVGLLFLLSVTFCVQQTMANENKSVNLTKDQIEFCCKIMSENYRIPFEEILFFAEYHNVYDLDKYGFLAYASQRDLEYVIDMKEKNTWARTEIMLGLAPNELKAAKDMCDANKLYVGLKLDYTVAVGILRQNFDVYETAMSMLLADSSKRIPLEIAKMKTPKMTWVELAKKIGVNEQEFTEIEAKINNCPNLKYLP